MVDLHCHILPGLDDGPETLEDSLRMAAVAEAAGIDTLVATPHIRDDHPFELELIGERLAELRAAIAEAGLTLEVLAAGEVAISKVGDLDDEQLAGLCLGEGRHLLVESPYMPAPALLERVLFDLQVRGFKPVLAHPERSLTFINDRMRLERLVERGVLCSVTAMSVAGAFGNTVKDFTMRLFATGLVHDIASDAHDAVGRPPGFESALRQMEASLEGDADTRWFVTAAPRAILTGTLSEPPPAIGLRPAGWKRIGKRVRLS